MVRASLCRGMTRGGIQEGSPRKRRLRATGKGCGERDCTSKAQQTKHSNMAWPARCSAVQCTKKKQYGERSVVGVDQSVMVK